MPQGVILPYFGNCAVSGLYIRQRKEAADHVIYEEDLVLLANKIIKIDIVDASGAVALTSEKYFTFPTNLYSDEDSILIIKGRGLREFQKDERVSIIATEKTGDRTRYAGIVSVSLDTQLNIKLLKSGDSQLLQERRRYFKIKVQENGRALFFVRDEDTIRFDEPYSILVHDINIGGIFMSCEYDFQIEDMVCLDIDLFVDYRLNAVVRVLRIQRDGEGEKLGYGCEFQGLTAAQEDYIGKYIYKAQFMQRQKEKAKNMEF